MGSQIGAWIGPGLCLTGLPPFQRFKDNVKQTFDREEEPLKSLIKKILPQAAIDFVRRQINGRQVAQPIMSMMAFMHHGKKPLRPDQNTPIPI